MASGYFIVDAAWAIGAVTEEQRVVIEATRTPEGMLAKLVEHPSV